MRQVISKIGIHRKPKTKGSTTGNATRSGSGKASLNDVSVTSSTADSLNAPSTSSTPAASSAVIAEQPEQTESRKQPEQAESRTMRAIKESLKLTLDLAEKALDGLPIPGVKGALGGLLTIIEAVETSHSNEKTLKALTDHISTMCSQILQPLVGCKESDISSGTKANIEQLFAKLRELLEKLERPVHGAVLRAIEASYDEGELADLAKEIEWAIREFHLRAQVANQLAHDHQNQALERLEDNDARTAHFEYLGLINLLPRVPEANYDYDRSDGPTECFEGTRVDVLEIVEGWVQNTSTEQPRVFWLNGLAGIGKSTIAKTIAVRTKEQGVLGGTFFFSRNEDALSSANRVIPTLAFQLAHSHPALLKAIAEVLRSDPDCGYKGLRMQFDKLIVSPLVAAAPSIPREHIVLLVLDALDECSSHSLAAELLGLFLARVNQVPFQLRIFITSRPEAHIRRVFEKADAQSNYSKCILHDIEESLVQKDIELYLKHYLDEIPTVLDVEMEDEWPKDTDMSILVKRSGKLFIYAATAIRFIRDDRIRDPQRQMDVLLGVRQAVKAKPYAHLDQLYLQVLRHALPDDSESDIVDRFCWVISCVVLLRNPLPLFVLSRFTGYREQEITNTFYHLHSIILAPSRPDQEPHIYHPSFSDFITNPERCEDPSFAVNVPLQERRLFLRCLQLMTEQLKRDFVNIGDSSLLNSDPEVKEKIRAGISIEVRYACRFWSSHLLKAEYGDREVIEELRKFAFSHLLYWFEVMSLLQAIATVGPTMKDVHHWITESKCDPGLVSLLYDGYRLILANSQLISERALHVYESALLFTPRDTLLFKTYEHELTMSSIRVLRGVRLSWSSCLSVVSSKDEVTALDISPDGTRLATGTESGIVGLWDVASASLIQTFNVDGDISSLAFNPDGVRICVGKTWSILVWDTIAGVCIHTLKDYRGSINSISVSAEKAQLASACSDGTVRVWDVDAGTCIAKLKASKKKVYSVAFVPDASQVVAGSQDGNIRLWDVATKTVLINFIGGVTPVLCVDVSRDGQYMASGFSSNYRNMAIGLFNFAPGTHESIRAMGDSSVDVTSVHFHPVDARLIYGSQGPSVALWDRESGKCVRKWNHLHNVTAVRYSPDGTRMVTASRNSSWRIWDASTSYTSESHSDDHTSPVISATFSEDGTRLATGSYDCTVKVWDTQSGNIIHTLHGHAEGIISLAFSLDGTMLASGSSDHTVRLWNVETSGKCTKVFRLGHHDYVKSMTFTDNGHLLADTLTKTIEWDLSNLRSSPVEEGHEFSGHKIRAMRASSEGYTVEVGDEGWLFLRKGESTRRLAQIPEDYPTSDPTKNRLLFSKDRVVITCENGCVLIIDVSLAKKALL